ncbi:MAG: hypothetical protein WC866_05155 [Patescibacteria group bacterium]
MPFESPATPEYVRPEPPLRARAGMKAIAWMGALVTLAGAAQHAEAAPKKTSEKKEVAQLRYEGTMRELPRRDDLDIEKMERKALPDGKVVTVYEGTHLLSDDEVKEERVLDVHVFEDGDANVQGDDRWSECQIIVKTYNDATRAKDFGYLCLDSASDARASGVHMDSPVGAYDFYGPTDKEWNKKGAAPKTGDDWTLFELNNLYWAVKGLKETGMDQSDAAQYLAKEFRGKVATAQSHEKRKPINQDVLDELK